MWIASKSHFVLSFVSLISLLALTAQALGEESLPTKEQEAPSPIPEYVPIVSDANLQSQLPCPSGSTQSVEDGALVCRRPPEHKAGIPPKDGPALWFHENGSLEQQGHYQDNKRQGAWWSFRDDGSLEGYTVYGEGEYDGLYVRFYPGGQLRQNESHFSKGKLNGVAKIWNREGKLETLTVYENDKVVEQHVFPANFLQATPEEVEALQEELRRIEAEQKRLLEEMEKQR
ncbi:MAG: hypothetical protein RBU37_00430 [Myxococcota bacterium]|jgi:hypothetical protein|nr:hypothetical protein [Myxococcota bacterium]